MSHKFQINLRGLIDLLSNHLYSGPEVFIRELLQNGVDAIRARTYLEPGHAGEILIEIHRQKGKPPTLVFADNGIGLTEEEIHRFLATIGESSKKSDHWQRPTDFIGQFGIGLLSCFVVSDEIVVVTRSMHGDHQALEWRGRPDGTYGIKTLEGDFAAGTQVYLTGKKDMEEYFEPERVRELVRHYGGLLPFPIRVTAGKTSEIANAGGAPWRNRFRNDRERTAALLQFGQDTFGARFFDAIPLRSEVGQVDGVAFVLPYTPNLATKQKHRVYLKNMLLSEESENLLPDWAFFVKAVVNANDLRPMASRESFYEDDKLEAARVALGQSLRDYLVDLSQRDPGKLQKFITLHDLAIKALAAQDDDVFRLFMDWLPFETSLGDMPFGEYRQQNPVIRYVPTVDQFRQIVQVAAAQGISVINAGYTYNNELLAKYAEVFPDAKIEAVDPSSLSQNFDDLELAEQEQFADFLQLADRVLKPFKCSAEVKKFQPKQMPALYTTGSEGRFLRSLEQSKEIADPLWSSVLDNMGRRERPAGPYAQLCFNHHNPLVRRLATVTAKPLVQKAVQMLYVQALLLGHHPLTGKELNLLNEGLLSFIEWGVEAREGE